MEHKKLIEELYLCVAQCSDCYEAGSREKYKNNTESFLKLVQECADICRLTAQLLEKKAANTNLFLKLCAEICEKCALECIKYKHLEHCEKCAEVCFRSAEYFNLYPLSN